MLLLDVNVLVYAHREDAPGHHSYRSWLEDLVNSDAAFALSELVLMGFLRVVTHPRVFSVPTGLDAAVEAAERLRGWPNSVPVSPGARHWDIFVRLCRRSGAKGNLVSDAYHAALAIESGSEWITTDRDYARFPDLRWRHPLEGG
ncbi:MAG: type II toxin-antitoxin system VapC family toxin [Actinobacteria bacterium]|nr:type II toxin-antitoxin system VapC family toxin [Actinomycetota bacterium]